MSDWIVPIVLMIPLAFCIGCLWGAGRLIQARQQAKTHRYDDLPPEAREAMDRAFGQMDGAFAEMDKAFAAIRKETRSRPA